MSHTGLKSNAQLHKEAAASREVQLARAKINLMWTCEYMIHPLLPPMLQITACIPRTLFYAVPCTTLYPPVPPCTTLYPLLPLGFLKGRQPKMTGLISHRTPSLVRFITEHETYSINNMSPRCGGITSTCVMSMCPEPPHCRHTAKHLRSSPGTQCTPHLPLRSWILLSTFLCGFLVRLFILPSAVFFSASFSGVSVAVRG